MNFYLNGKEGLKHNASLGTDPSLVNHNPATFSVPQSLKNLTSPLRQTKSQDNSNMSYMFQNNIYTNFKTTYKHALIPSYVIRVI